MRRRLRDGEVRWLSTLQRRMRTASVVALVLAVPVSSRAGEPAASSDAPATRSGAPWQGRIVEGESALFVQDEPGAPPRAQLFFPPSRIVSLRSATGRSAYSEGVDYVLEPGTRTLRLPPGSRIPWKTRAELRPPPGASPTAVRGAPGENDLFTAEGHVLHDLQVAVTYEHDEAWPGPRPRYAGSALPRTVARLRGKEGLRVSILGDSIPYGLDASGFTEAPPYQSPFGELFVQGLRAAFGAEIAFANASVPGLDTATALELAPGVGATGPDLVVVALGLNDLTARRPAAELQRNVRGIVAAVRAARPEAELILIAPLLANPAWIEGDVKLQRAYRDALVHLRGRGIAVVDLTALWETLLTRKAYVDLSGNQLNHPNDFGHRLYAEALLALLVPEAPEPRTVRTAEPSATAASTEALERASQGKPKGR